MTAPFFSIIILYWQNAQYLPTCLRALSAQTCQNFEVILVDNASPEPFDPSCLDLFSHLNIHLLRSEVNLGFTGGNNLAARSARGEYLVLLNADAFPEPEWLARIQAAIPEHPDTFFASRLIMANNPLRLDGEWNVYHASGLVWRKSHGRPLSTATATEKYVLSACAAAGVYPKQAFESVHGFDEDFFAYMEDVDMDFRMQLQGYRCLYLPNATVRHVGSASTSTRSAMVVFHGHRNLVWTYFKDMPGLLFWFLLPCHILINLFYLVAGLFMPTRKEMARAKWEALKGLPKAIKKRKEIQANRKVSTWQIARLLDWNPLSPLIKLSYR